MLKDISEEEKETQNEQEIKSLLSKIIVRDINKAKIHFNNIKIAIILLKEFSH